MSTTIGVKVDESLKVRLRKLAEARERTPHWLIRAAIAEYLDKEERYQRELEEDNAAWDEFALTGKALTHAEVRSFFAEKIRKRDSRAGTVGRKSATGSRPSPRLSRRKGH